MTRACGKTPFFPFHCCCGCSPPSSASCSLQYCCWVSPECKRAQAPPGLSSCASTRQVLDELLLASWGLGDAALSARLALAYACFAWLLVRGEPSQQGLEEPSGTSLPHCLHISFQFSSVNISLPLLNIVSQFLSARVLFNL